MGKNENKWNDIINNFSLSIKYLTTNKKFVDLSTSKFSISNIVNSNVNNIVLMSCFESYIDYNFHTLCGIPEIEIWGTMEDWLKLKELINCVGECDLVWWTKNLVPVIDKIIDTLNDNIDYDFWASIIKCNSSSGGDYINGYLARFIPLKEGKYLDWSDENTRIATRYITKDLSIVPVDWINNGDIINLSFVGDIINLSFVGGIFSPFITADNKIGVVHGFIITSSNNTIISKIKNEIVCTDKKIKLKKKIIDKLKHKISSSKNIRNYVHKLKQIFRNSHSNSCESLTKRLEVFVSVRELEQILEKLKDVFYDSKQKKYDVMFFLMSENKCLSIFYENLSSIFNEIYELNISDKNCEDFLDFFDEKDKLDNINLKCKDYYKQLSLVYNEIDSLYYEKENIKTKFFQWKMFN